MINIAGGVTRRVLLKGAAALGAGTLAAPWVARAQTSISMGIGGIDPHFSVFYVAQSAGYFKDNGIDVEYVNVQNGARMRQAVAAGQTLVGMASPFDPLVMTLAGKPGSLIFNTDRKISYAIVLVGKEDFDSGAIRSISDLAGKTVAVTQPASAFWAIVSYLVENAGVGGKVDFRTMADMPTMMGALKTKQVQAIPASLNMIGQAVTDGWGAPIFSITDEAAWNGLIGGDLPGICAMAARSDIDSRSEDIQAVVSALVKAQDFLLTKTPEEIADLVYEEYLSAFPRTQVLSAYSVFQSYTWTRENIPSPDVYARILNMALGGGIVEKAKALEVSYEACVEPSFVAKARSA